MATYMAPDTMPHGIAVLVMRRDEAETLASYLSAAMDAGIITKNTDLGDVTEAMRHGNKSLNDWTVIGDVVR